MKTLILTCLCVAASYGQVDTANHGTFIGALATIEPFYNFTFAGHNGAVTFKMGSDTLKIETMMPVDSTARLILESMTEYWPTHIRTYQDTIATLRKRLKNAEAIIKQYREGTRKRK